MNISSPLMPMLGPLAFVWFAFVAISTAIIHISLALAVLDDSKRMILTLQRGTFLVGGGIWALATLLGGFMAAGVYWLIHHSSLRPDVVTRGC